MNFQREGASSNSNVGAEFETIVQDYFNQLLGINLIKGFSVPIGVGTSKKNHKFDLGITNNDIKLVVECKSHKWTEGDNVPSAKMTVWNEAMYYFYLLPKDVRKILVILKDNSVKRSITLGKYYIETYQHLIPDEVEIFEYDEISKTMEQIC
jgi:hypothetical protein